MKNYATKLETKKLDIITLFTTVLVFDATSFAYLIALGVFKHGK